MWDGRNEGKELGWMVWVSKDGGGGGEKQSGLVWQLISRQVLKYNICLSVCVCVNVCVYLCVCVTFKLFNVHFKC